MSEVAINIEGLWKRYKVGSKKSSSLRESLMNIFNRDELNYFWALQDINFEVKKGEAIGIIGRNGAGKSTLLKVLSKITYPTKGKVEINGRVSSLLEVGTGFHPELSGRQNIYLNGTILGMTRKEINQKFDEIVAFSGVEKFIDTPVKHYSSGMKVRLAFSVAAHLEPEILIIDEVLAVGDAEFQRKCLGKMETVAQEGRTVLFVSHNLPAVLNLCSRGVVLLKGEVFCDHPIQEAVHKYIGNSHDPMTGSSILNVENRRGIGNVLFESIILRRNKLKVRERIEFSCVIKNHTGEIRSKNIDFGFSIHDEYDTNLIHGSNRFIDKVIPFDDNLKCLSIKVDNILRPGNYFFTLFLRVNGEVQDWIRHVGHFEVLEGNPYEFANSNEIKGILMPDFDIDSE